MEVSYGIGVKNRYSLFMCDEVIDPLDILSKPHKENIKSTANTNVSVNNAVNSAKTKVTSKKTSNTNTDTKLAKEKMVNGGSNVNANVAKNKLSTGQSQKLNTGSGKAQGKDTTSNSNSMNTASNRKKDKIDKTNRPLRQDKKALNNAVNWANNASLDNSKNHGTSVNTNAPRHQRDLEERKNRQNRSNRQNRENRETREPREGSYTVDKPAKQYMELSEVRGDDMRLNRGRKGQSYFRPRGRARGGVYDNRGKREYDRHSGSDKSGVKPIEKRDGSGAYNWGNPADDFAAQMNATLEEGQEREENGQDGSGQKVTMENWSTNHSDEKGKEVVDDGHREMTLDEWKKQEQEKRILPNYNLRKGGEGEETLKWRKGYVLKRKDKEEEEEEEKEYEEVEVEEEIKPGRQKRILDIEIKFKDDNRDLRNRRGRGGGRGGRGGGSGRGARGGDRDGGDFKGNRRGGTYRESKEQMAPKVDDWNDFPSLSTA